MHCVPQHFVSVPNSFPNSLLHFHLFQFGSWETTTTSNALPLSINSLFLSDAQQMIFAQTTRRSTMRRDATSTHHITSSKLCITPKNLQFEFSLRTPATRSGHPCTHSRYSNLDMEIHSLLCSYAYIKLLTFKMLFVYLANALQTQEHFKKTSPRTSRTLR